MQVDKGISIIGSGNVAWHLAYAFKNAGIRINIIISRSEENAKALADELNVPYSTSTAEIPDKSSLILICVSDSAVEEVSKSIRNLEIPVAHTSGSIPLSTLGESRTNAGVFYPFQTFTKYIRLGEVKFPVCIEAQNNEMLEMLEFFANKITDKVYKLNSEQRKYIHLAGVIANNFTNYLITQAYEFLEQESIDPGILIPLIEEFVAKIKADHPRNIQTGPARRGNLQVIAEHESLLQDNKNLCELYTILSNNIINYYKLEG